MKYFYLLGYCFLLLIACNPATKEDKTQELSEILVENQSSSVTETNTTENTKTEEKEEEEVKQKPLALIEKVYPEMYEVFHCKNPNGTVETLLALYGKEYRSFIYKSANKPNQEIALINMSNLNDEEFVVRFPNQTANYKLVTCIACPQIKCTNPDGSVQTFELDYSTWGNRGTFRCENFDKSVEYLRIEGFSNELTVKYRNEKETEWKNLLVTNMHAGEMDVIRWFDVDFPNKQPYEGARIEANSPSGYTVSVACPNGGGACPKNFEWINK